MPPRIPVTPSLPEPARLRRLQEGVIDWYARNARDLPWRDENTGPWGVYVSEVMSHQTPVARVEPVWRQWMQRWPEPAALAADSPGEAVREWGRLGYPRRALQLHESAVAMVDRHDGQVPADYDQLLALPGVGAYTAGAVMAFAFGRRATVLDVNIRRVQARAVSGRALPDPAVSRLETALATALLPLADADSAVWNAGVMELGALICTARNPACETCPLTADCAWMEAGRPPHEGPPPRGQAWHGTDRQVRGKLMAVLRESPGPVPAHVLEAVWPDKTQRDRCLQGLLTDGLAAETTTDDGAQTYALPR